MFNLVIFCSLSFIGIWIESSFVSKTEKWHTSVKQTRQISSWMVFMRSICHLSIYMSQAAAECEGAPPLTYIIFFGSWCPQKGTMAILDYTNTLYWIFWHVIIKHFLLEKPPSDSINIAFNICSRVHKNDLVFIFYRIESI